MLKDDKSSNERVEAVQKGLEGDPVPLQKLLQCDSDLWGATLMCGERPHRLASYMVYEAAICHKVEPLCQLVQTLHNNALIPLDAEQVMLKEAILCDATDLVDLLINGLHLLDRAEPSYVLNEIEYDALEAVNYAVPFERKAPRLKDLEAQAEQAFVRLTLLLTGKRLGDETPHHRSPAQNKRKSHDSSLPLPRSPFFPSQPVRKRSLNPKSAQRVPLGPRQLGSIHEVQEQELTKKRSTRL